MQSTLFLNELTCIDHAYIDAQGFIRGGSFLPSFLVSGDVTSDENVVEDFSSVKKRLKSEIDDHCTGLDHKVWLLGDSRTVGHSIDDKGQSIVTPKVVIELDKNAVAVLPSLKGYNTESVGHFTSKWLSDKFSPLVIECLNSDKPQTIDPMSVGLNQTETVKFRYVHGLRASSAYGCQNIAHGHSSFLQLIGNNMRLTARTLAYEISLHLADAIFVWRANISPTFNFGKSSILRVEYDSGSRGTMSMTFTNREEHNVIVLDTETTIEYICNFIGLFYKEELRKNHVEYLVISEGLSKGSLLRVVDL